jgi:putative flippase GtrA
MILSNLIYNPRERTRFVRFAVVGVIGAIVDFGIANIMVFIFSAPLVIAGSISFVCAIMSNFIWNRFWTYPDSRSKQIAQQFVQFSFVSVIGLAIRIPILHSLEPIFDHILNAMHFPLPAFGIDFYAKNMTLVVAVIIVMFWNFFINRYWTYNDVS